MAKVKTYRVWETIGGTDISAWLPRRPRNAHKGDFGRVLLLCGAVGYTGAPVLAATAAVRSGAGLVFTGVPQTIYPIIAGRLLEPMVFPLPDADGMLSEQAIPEILNRLKTCDACLIGCGLGRSEGVRRVVEAVLSEAVCPVVVDADGINALERHIDVLRGAACPVVLTPHDGEYASLMGQKPTEDRRKAAWKLHEATGATVLLKGHRTLICGDGGCYVNRCGNPGLATGGSGDVLAGILTCLLGQGMEPVKAAAGAVWIHGAAGDLSRDRLGPRSMLPTDMIDALSSILK